MVSKREALEEILRIHRATAAVQFDLEELVSALQSRKDGRFLLGSWLSGALSAAIRRFMTRPDVEAAEALHFLSLSGDLKPGPHLSVHSVALEHLQAWWQTHEQKVDLLGFSRLWRGQPEDWLLAFQDRTWNFSWPQLEDEFLRPYLQERLGYLLGSLEVPGYPPPQPLACDWSAGLARSLKLLRRLPAPPPQARERLWQLALGEARQERELAQECLQGDQGWQPRLLENLRGKQAGPRQRAAEWAGRSRLLEALPDLQAALQKEKVEKCRLAQMEALKRLGAPLEVYLNRDGLLAEARSALTKGRPAWLAGVPLAPLHWKEGGQPVEGELLEGLVVGAVRVKSPEPSAWLKTVCHHLEQEARQRWGRALLDWWIESDLAGRLSAQEIEARLPAAVASLTQLYQVLGQPRTASSLESEARRQLSQQVEGSAIEHKGVLALAGACGGVGLVEGVQGYLKEWYGLRAAQCKALVAMLAHAEELEAVQYLLSVARRFRTKGIQEEARRRLQERAERLGWTLEDMADLSLPDAGLDEAGRFSVDLGDREVTFQLQLDLSWHPKNLPGGGEPEKVKEATRAWKAAQKTVKEVGKSLGHRLYDAMCSGRCWSYATWQTCLMQHPVASRVCQTVVWMAQGQTFRPSEDGSLIDCHQNTLTADPDWTVTVAHPVYLEEDQVQSWSAQLADYGIIPSFAQLGRPPRPKPAQPGDDFQGYLLTSFALRNRAKALGYERAPAEDGGVFTEYRKGLGTSGWTIRVLFSGSELPETDHPVALQGLAFELNGRPAEHAQVPAALWSEAWNDGAEMARAGSGLDANWQSRVTLR